MNMHLSGLGLYPIVAWRRARSGGPGGDRTTALNGDGSQGGHPGFRSPTNLHRSWMTPAQADHGQVVGLFGRVVHTRACTGGGGEQRSGDQRHLGNSRENRGRIRKDVG